MPLDAEDQRELTLADEEWMPDDVKRALDCRHMPVIFYEEKLRSQVYDYCKDSHLIGLTQIRLGPAKHILICMTTQHYIIVFEMLQKSHVEMVKYLTTKESDLEFSTIRGQFMYLSLLMEFGIKLRNTTDLLAFDIFLSMRKCCLVGAIPGEYAMQRLLELPEWIRFRNRNELLESWLDVKLPPKDTALEKIETQVIKEQPTSVAAKNVIRKRSCFTRSLALKMMEQFDKITYQDVENLYTFAHKVKGERYVEYHNLGDNSYATVIDYLKNQESLES